MKSIHWSRWIVVGRARAGARRAERIPPRPAATVRPAAPARWTNVRRSIDRIREGRTRPSYASGRARARPGPRATIGRGRAPATPERGDSVNIARTEVRGFQEESAVHSIREPGLAVPGCRFIGPRYRRVASAASTTVVSTAV